MKKQKQFLALLFTLGVWLGASTAQAASSGAVAEWGYNFWVYGQTDVPVAAQSGVTAIAAGYSLTVALRNDGAVVVWGFNGQGQTMVPVTAQSGVTGIAAGNFHIVAVKSDGSVVAWGSNDYGQTTVPPAAQSGVTAIAAGARHTVALKGDGSVVAWGDNDHGQTTVPPAAQSGVTAIAAGHYSLTVALKNDGTVVSWGGTNPYGPTDVPVAAQGRVTAIAVGGVRTVVLAIPVAPNITTQPVSQTVNVWQSASFEVAAAGFPLYYQWRKDGVNLAGATSPTYSLPLTPINQAGSYTVVVSNPAGSVTSAPPAVLTVNAVTPTLHATPGANQLVLSWPTNAAGFTLQSTANLTPPVMWVDSSKPPVVIGAQFMITNPISGNAQFYRLRRP
jgi:hypothetical protein